MEHLKQSFDVSERRACRVAGQPRATQRYRAAPPSSADRALVADIRELAARHPRYGYRRVRVLLGRLGWKLSLGKMLRIWRREGLRVPHKRRKRRRLGHSGNSCTRRAAERPNHVWTYDFVMDRTADGRRVKILAVVDEYTRECLCLHAARNITARDVVDELAKIVIERGVPGHIRSDNGPEFVAAEVRRWLGCIDAAPLFIEPGSPWQNAYIESFNGKLADELLDIEVFTTLAEARYLADRFRHEYNTTRPHSSLGDLTPAAFAAGWAASGLATLGLQPPTPGTEHHGLQPQAAAAPRTHRLS